MHPLQEEVLTEQLIHSNPRLANKECLFSSPAKGKNNSLTAQNFLTQRFQVSSERKAVSLPHLTKSFQVRGQEGKETQFCDSYLAIIHPRYATKILNSIVVVTYICLLKGKCFVQFCPTSLNLTLLYTLRPGSYFFSDANHCVQTNLLSSSAILYVFVAEKLYDSKNIHL